MNYLGQSGMFGNSGGAMAFDYESERLFCIKTLGGGDFMELNQTTGTGTRLGSVGYPVSMLYTHYGTGSGINRFGMADVTLYPNPATDKITIENANGSAIKLYDISGKVLFESYIQEDNAEINISTFASGVYFIDLQTKDAKTTQKLIKK